MHALTTLAVNRSITQLEQAGTRYIEEQLFYAVCHTLLAPLRVALAKVRIALTLPAPLSRASVARALTRWIDHHGVPDGLLRSGLEPAGEVRPPPAADLDRYGLPQVLVCQDTNIALMLRANAFDLELACPVFTAQAWPLPDPIIAMLRRAHRSRIMILHDASLSGLALARQLAATAPPDIPLQPIGLRPRHAKTLRLCAQRRIPPSMLADLALAHDERRWLQRGWQAEVAAVYPIKLLRALRAIVSATPQPVSWRTRWRFFVTSGFTSWPAWQEAL
ncbi:MAG: hypothetical protein N2385_09610 [Chloroflexus sp.]|nr:hypothetical protein [Chloroflexus sp.]